MKRFTAILMILMLLCGTACAEAVNEREKRDILCLSIGQMQIDDGIVYEVCGGETVSIYAPEADVISVAVEINGEPEVSYDFTGNDMGAIVMKHEVGDSMTMKIDAKAGDEVLASRTAQFVFVEPVGIDQQVFLGNRRLAEEGAYPVNSGDTIDVYASSENGIKAIGWYFNVDGENSEITDVFDDHACIEVPVMARHSCVYLYIETVDSSDARTGWKRFYLCR